MRPLFKLSAFLILSMVLAVQLAPAQFDCVETQKSNIRTWVANNGSIGYAKGQSDLGGIWWPREQPGRYCSGGGFWFGAVKRSGDQGAIQKLVVASFEPTATLNNPSWLVPGSWADGSAVLLDDESQRKYRVYPSTRFQNDGSPIEASDYFAWPIWHTETALTPGVDRYFGALIAEADERSVTRQPGGPVFISHEDIVCSYKDSDLNFYPDPPDLPSGTSKEEYYASRGNPPGLQFHQAVYTWKDPHKADMMILRYTIRNTSDDNLYECVFNAVYDIDISRSATSGSQANDRLRYVDEDRSLDMLLAWSEATDGDANQGLGYFGLVLLESPVADAEGFARPDGSVYHRDEPGVIGGMRNISAQLYPTRTEEKYDLMTSSVIDNTPYPADWMMTLATRRFSLRPGQETVVALALVFGPPAEGGEANGSPDDARIVVERARNAHHIYDNDLTITDVATGRDQESALSIQSLSASPSADFAELTFTMDTTERLRLQIFAANGAKLADIDSGVHAAGTYQSRIPLQSASRGLYLLRLATPSSHAAKPLLLLR